MKENYIKKLVFAAVCLALCMVLPFLTGQIPQVGSALSPMHIPVLLAGAICGWPLGLLVGLIAPILRFVLFGMPPLMPYGLAMTFELAAYGAAFGLIYHMMKKNNINLYVALIASMLIGRVVWGLAMYAILGLTGGAFTFAAFLAGGFVNAVPGIILHIAIIPPIIMALRKAGIFFND